MAQCDMCGKEKELVSAIVEGCMLSVCDSCVQHGNVVAVPKPRPVSRTRVEDDIDPEPELIVSDASSKVKAAREKKGLTQEQLAKALAEKEAVIHRIESGKSEPDLRLASKLEQFLGISLIERYKLGQSDDERKLDLKDEGLTIGDLIKIKQSKK